MKYQDILKQYQGVAIDWRKQRVVEQAIDDLLSAATLTDDFKKDVVKVIVARIAEGVAEVKEINSLRSTAVREAVIKRDKYQCVFCGARLTIRTAELDHDIPWAKGGTDHPANLQATCLHCNRAKGDRTSTEFRQELTKGMRLVFSKNAMKAMRLRGVSHQSVAAAFRKGVYDRPGGDGQLVREASVRGRRLAIVYRVEDDKAFVVTIYEAAAKRGWMCNMIVRHLL